MSTGETNIISTLYKINPGAKRSEGRQRNTWLWNVIKDLKKKMVKDRRERAEIIRQAFIHQGPRYARQREREREDIYIYIYLSFTTLSLFFRVTLLFGHLRLGKMNWFRIEILNNCLLDFTRRI